MRRGGDGEACVPIKAEKQGPAPSINRLRVVNPDRPMAASADDRRIAAVVAATEARPGSNRNSQASVESNNGSAKSQRKTHVGPWQLGKDLGSGSTARVRKARHVVTGQLAAVKIISRTAFTSEDPGKSFRVREPLEIGIDEIRRLPFGIEREVVIMKLLKHQHVIQLYDVWENRGELWV